MALGYDFLSDFPETLNPFSLANSLLAGLLPTYLLDGGTIKGADTDTIIGNLIGLLTLGTPPAPPTARSCPTTCHCWSRCGCRRASSTRYSNRSGVPITLGTPLADALQPALSILVNIGYTDVQTPSEGGTYNRTYDQSGQYVPFLSRATLTPQEWAAVPGDVVKALVNGFRDVLSGKSTSAPNVPDPHAPQLPVAAVPSTATATAVTTAAEPSAKSGKPSKKSSGGATSKKPSAPKASAKKGVGGSKRAAS